MGNVIKMSKIDTPNPILGSNFLKEHHFTDGRLIKNSIQKHQPCSNNVCHFRQQKISKYILFISFVTVSWFFLNNSINVFVFQKVHTFQKSLEAVMQRLVEAEREQSVLNEAETFAGVTENEILLFRNQLKVVEILP